MIGARTALAALALLLACGGSDGKDGLTKAAESCDQACTDPARGGSAAYAGGMLCGAAWTCRCALPGEPEASVCDPIVRIGIIADTHLGADTVQPVVTLAGEAAAQMAGWKPHLLAHAGDIVLSTQPDYALYLDPLVAAYALPGVPRLLTIGHWDVLSGVKSIDTIRNAFPPDASSWLEPGLMYGSVDIRGVHVVVLDDTYQELEPATRGGLGATVNHDGYIPQAERDWLVADLAATRLPTVIFVHSGTGTRDPYYADSQLDNAADMTAIFEAHRGKIAAVINGHWHREAYGRVNGINYLTVSALGPKNDPVTPHDRGNHSQLEVDTESGRLLYTVWENDSARGYLEVLRRELPF